MLTVPALTLRFRSRYPAVTRSVRAIRSDVLDIARDCGAEGECLEEVRLAVSEAAREAVTHGMADAHLRVQIELGDAELVVTVSGDGAADADARMCFPCGRAVDREHDSAIERLEGALMEQAAGTATELVACAQRAEVAARQAWVHWVDDEAYRGVNAGPFELRASDPAGADGALRPR